MSGKYSSRLRGGGAGGGLGATTALAAKVAFASAALAVAASLAWVAVPQLVSGADGFLWKLFLFVTVHVIIFFIWKLSDSKHFHAAAQQHKDPWAPVPHHPAPPLLAEDEDVVLSAMKRKEEFAPAAGAARAEEYRVPLPVSRPHIGAASWPVDEGVVSPRSSGGESCVTTESEEDACSAAASAYVSTNDERRSLTPAPARERERAVVMRGLSVPPPQAMAATDEHLDGGADHDDDLDATWNAIMQRTRPATAPASSSPQAPRSSPPQQRARDPSIGAAELSKRSDDFINKIHNSFGRQQ